MKKAVAIFALLNFMAVFAQKTGSGFIIHYGNFKSDFVVPRDIDVWLPDGYSVNEKYAVLYMHDGQMLFDADASFNKQEWRVDETCGKLMAEGKTKKFIVVAVSNVPENRHSDYFPQKPFESLPKKTQDSILDLSLAPTMKLFGTKVDSDNYLKFIVKELKPFIDKKFSVKPDKANTFIMGSSMGALISMYAICEYPDVFGGAACLSTHWPGVFAEEKNPVPSAFISYLSAHLPNPKTHKIYFDYGDQTLDAFYKPYQSEVDEILKTKGYADKKNWLTLFFPGAEHSEKSWSERLDAPILFLLGK